MAAGALGHNSNDKIKLAAIIEFLHTATLLHDDVVDHSGMRRGKVTANARWGNAPSVLVGDFLYSRAFQLMVEVGSLEIMGVLSGATNTIAEGEVMQLTNIGNVALTEDEYSEVIRCKTALLFEAATHTGALLETDRQHTDTLRRFGLHFGLTYQLVDDWLDYAGDSETLGKNVGDDLAEGKLTLPLIHALATAPSADAELIKSSVAARSAEDLPRIVDIVTRSGSLEYTHQAAVQEAKLASDCIAQLPPPPTLTRYKPSRNSVSRGYFEHTRCTGAGVPWHMEHPEPAYLGHRIHPLPPQRQRRQRKSGCPVR